MKKAISWRSFFSLSIYGSKRKEGFWAKSLSFFLFLFLFLFLFSFSFSFFPFLLVTGSAMEMSTLMYSAAGSSLIMASFGSFFHGYWKYFNFILISFPLASLFLFRPQPPCCSFERKARIVRRAEGIQDLKTLKQRIGTQRDFIQNLTGPTIFCKMSGTIGCKPNLYSGATGVPVRPPSLSPFPFNSPPPFPFPFPSP